MKTHVENLSEAFELKGKRLTVTEAQIIKIRGNDDKYEMYLDANGNIAYRLI